MTSRFRKGAAKRIQWSYLKGDLRMLGRSLIIQGFTFFAAEYSRQSVP